MLRLNLGAGALGIAGYTSVDLAGASVIHDLGVFPWPFEDGSAEHIVASHVLEHFDRTTGARFIAECWRVLCRGGRLSIAVPDMDKFCDALVTGDYKPLGGYLLTDLNAFMGGGAAEHRPEWRHYYMYCWHSLAHILEEWFPIVERRPAPAAWDNPAHAAFSLYVDALK